MSLSAKSIAPVLIAVTVPAIGYLGFSDHFAFLFGTFTDNAIFKREVVELRSPVAGQIAAINVDDGDRVRTGSTLLIIEQRQVDYDVDSANYERRGYRDRISANSRAASASRRRSSSLRTAAEHCDASLRLLAKQLSRSQSLIDKGFVSRSSYDANKSVFEQRQSECITLIADAEAEERQLATIEADTSDVVGRYHGSRNASRKGADEIQRGILKAPFPSVIGNRRVAIGMTVQVGTPLMTVVSTDKVWVEASFREDQLGRLRIGTPVRAVAPALEGHVFYGRITAIGGATVGTYATTAVRSNAGTFTRLTQWVPIRIALDPDPMIDRLPAGASCQVSI